MLTSVRALFANYLGREILSARWIFLDDTLVTYRRKGRDGLGRGRQNGRFGRHEVTDAAATPQRAITTQ